MESCLLCISLLITTFLLQLQNILTALEAFLLTVEDMENSLRHPRPYMFCYHNTPQPQCIHTTADHFCPTTDAIKYKMVRASVDGINLNLVESGTILSIEVRLSKRKNFIFS